MFTAPLLINITTLIAVFIEYQMYSTSFNKPTFLYELLIVLFLLALINFAIILSVRINCEKKLKGIQI